MTEGGGRGYPLVPFFHFTNYMSKLFIDIIKDIYSNSNETGSFYTTRKPEITNYEQLIQLRFKQNDATSGSAMQNYDRE